MKYKDPLHFGYSELTVAYQDKQFTISKRFLDAHPTGWGNLHKLKRRYLKKMIIFTMMAKEEDVESLRQLADKVTENEFEIQSLFGFDKDAKFHRFWEMPKCECPVLDNQDRWGTGYSIYTDGCPIHGDI